MFSGSVGNAMDCLLVHIFMAGRSACLPEVVTFEKARLLTSTDHRSAGFFLPPSDFDAIETVYCNACVEDSPSKILQHVLHVFGVHVQTWGTSVQRKIFIDFSMFVPNSKGICLCIYNSIKEFCFIVF